MSRDILTSWLTDNQYDDSYATRHCKKGADDTTTAVGLLVRTYEAPRLLRSRGVTVNILQN